MNMNKCCRPTVKFHSLYFYANNNCDMYPNNSIRCFGEQGFTHKTNAKKVMTRFVDLILKKSLGILLQFAIDSPITRDAGQSNCITHLI